MASPPKKPGPRSPDESGGLEEVERALSVLGGRHPEAVRAAREADEAKDERERARADEAVAAVRRSKLRVGVAVLALVAVALVALVGLRLHARTKAHDDAFRTKEARLVALGFVEVDDLSGDHAPRIEAHDASCFAVVTDPSAAADLDVARGPSTIHATGDAIFCTCGDETILPSSSVELRVLRAPATEVGGLFVLAHTLRETRTLVPGSEACDVEHLADWGRGGRAPKGPPSAPLPDESALTERGFHAEPGLAPGFPFVFVAPAQDRCVVALAEEGETIAFVSHEKDVPPRARAVAFCDAKGVGAVLELDGTKMVRVASVSAKRVGGVLGFRETLAIAAIDAAVWVRDDDRATFAEETLHASLVPDPKSVANAQLPASTAPDARVVLVAAKDGAMYVAEGPPEATFLCGPTMSAAAPETVCVQTKAHSWHLPHPDTVGALAYGPLPFWMSGLASVSADRAGAALTPELALLRLARRLAARGFDATIVEGITERENGVDVLGRSGEDAVVVVGTWPAPPWTHTYTDTAPWTLDDEPRVIPLRGGDHLSLIAKPPPPVPPGPRRTVVFRHAAK